MSENALALPDRILPVSIDLPDENIIRKDLERIRAFQAICKRVLIKGHDYGIIPGTEKPTLLKPGAEKIAKLLKLSDDYQVISSVEDWEKPLFAYTIKCFLCDIGTRLLISTGIGSCNSMEAKYRWRWIAEWKLEGRDTTNVPCETRTGKKGPFKVYRFENDDIYTIENTIKKMAKKRALVDAALSAGRLSDIFTQDMEDIVRNGKDKVEDELVDGQTYFSDPVIIQKLVPRQNADKSKTWFEIWTDLGESFTCFDTKLRDLALKYAEVQEVVIEFIAKKSGRTIFKNVQKITPFMLDEEGGQDVPTE